MAEKKKPYSFTIGFNAKNAAHVQAAEILNQYGRGEKADYIAKVILAYEGKAYENAAAIDIEVLRNVVRELLTEEYGRSSQQITIEEIKDTVIDVSEKTAKDPEMSACLSRGLAAFRNL